MPDMEMETDVAIIGGGPAGLSAGLFTAKNGLNTTIFDTDDTAMHSAQLRNYLGIERMRGTEFMKIARKQTDDHGADRHQGVTVTAVETTDNGFRVTANADTEGDETYDAQYVIFACGRSRELAEELGCELADDGTVAINTDCETTVANAYATGWTVRQGKIQAIISAGHGAAAAIDILSKERDGAFHDFNSPGAYG